MCAMGTVVLLAACRQPNPDWLGPAGQSASSEATTSSGDGESTVTDSSGSGPNACAPAPLLGTGECPEACTRCDAGRCVIDCAERDCEDDTVECPEGWPCDVRCEGEDACRGTRLECGDGECTIDCQGDSACENARVRCGSAPCAVTCGPQHDACDDLDVDCGEADSTVTCDGSHDVDLDFDEDDSSCTCEALGCD